MQIGQKKLLENQHVPFGESQKLCQLRIGPYRMTKGFTEDIFENPLDADPTSTQVVNRNHLVEYFPPDNELPNFLSNYVKPFNDVNTEHFYTSIANMQNTDYLSWINLLAHLLNENNWTTTYISSLKLIEFHKRTPHSTRLTPFDAKLYSEFPDSGVPQSSFHTPLSFQPESPVTTSQPNTHFPLPRTSSINPINFLSTSTGTTPRSKNAATIQKIPREWQGMSYF